MSLLATPPCTRFSCSSMHIIVLCIQASLNFLMSNKKKALLCHFCPFLSHFHISQDVRGFVTKPTLWTFIFVDRSRWSENSIQLMGHCGDSGLEIRTDLHPNLGQVNDHSPLQTALISPFLVAKRVWKSAFIFVKSRNLDSPSSKSQSCKRPLAPSESATVILPFLVAQKMTRKSLQLGNFIFRLIVVPGNSAWSSWRSPTSSTWSGKWPLTPSESATVISPFLVAKKRTRKRQLELFIFVDGVWKFRLPFI